MNSQLRKLERWLKAHRHALLPGKEYACWNDGIVTYRPSDAPATQIRGVLHECGHVLVGRTIARGRGTRYLRGYPSEHKKGARTSVSAVDLVDEEIDAWHRGYALARRLGLRIDVRAYWRDYGMYIKRYFRRALAREI